MSPTFMLELRAELDRTRERVELLERVLGFYEEEGSLNGAPGARGRRQKKARDTAARPPRTRAGAAEAAQARFAQPVETEQGKPPSAPRSPANGARKHHLAPTDLHAGKK